jgi:rod shape-determining protein MreB
VRRPAHDIAVDLGTAYVRLSAPGRGLVLEEPSVVRVRRSPLSVENVGARAAEDRGADRSSFPVRPVLKGVVRDVECAAWLLAPLLRRARGLTLVRPAVLACAPSDATAAEREAVSDALLRAGASRVAILPEPLAAAVGAGLDVASPYVHMLVDVGEGVTDVAVIREGRIELAVAARIGCADLRSRVADLVASSFGVLASGAEIESLIRRADLASPDEVLPLGGARGSTPALTAATVVSAMASVLDEMARLVHGDWLRLPDRESCQAIESGICLTGGGATLRSLGETIARRTRIDVRVPPRPTHAVIAGAGRMAFVPRDR